MGISPASLISAPHGGVGSAPRMDPASRFRRNWRLYQVPTSSESQQSSLSYSATAWSQAIWMALMLCGLTLKVIVSVWHLALAALAFQMAQLWCSCSVRCTSIQTPSKGVATLSNCIEPSPSY